MTLDVPPKYNRVKISLSHADAVWLVEFLSSLHSTFPDSHLETVHYDVLLGLHHGRPGDIPDSEILRHD